MTLNDAYQQLDFIETPLFVLEVNDDGLPVYAAFNACARAVSGRPLSDYLGRTARQVYPAAHGRTAFARHCQVIDTRQTRSYALQLPLAGALHTVQTTLRPELDAQGRVVRMYGTSIDITAENEAREAQATLQTAASEMEQFVAMAAHDLRAPMRNVAMLAQILREDFVDHGDGKVEMIDMLDGVAEKTMGLINDVLTHAQSIDVKPEDSDFDLGELVCLICDVIDPEEKHRFTATPAVLASDRTLLQIVLRNLIDNTVKYAGQARILVDIAVTQNDPGTLCVTLEDNGKGFSHGALKLMNEGMFRVDSGYGLFGVRRLIRARGGTVVAENSPVTGGALMRFTLPGRIVSVQGAEHDGFSAAPADLMIAGRQRHSA